MSFLSGIMYSFDRLLRVVSDNDLQEIQQAMDKVGAEEIATLTQEGPFYYEDEDGDVDEIEENDEEGMTLLFEARTPEMALLLINAGADVNARTAFGITPLQNAKSIPVVEVLINYGADMEIKGDDGLTDSEYLRRHGENGLADYIDQRLEEQKRTEMDRTVSEDLDIDMRL